MKKKNYPELWLKLNKLFEVHPSINNFTDLANRLDISPGTITHWTNVETMELKWEKELNKIFGLQSGDLCKPREEFYRDHIQNRKSCLSLSYWEHLLTDAEKKPVTTIHRVEKSQHKPELGSSRMIGEDEEDEPLDTYRRGERIYLDITIPENLTALTHKLVLVKADNGKKYCVCPSPNCESTEIKSQSFTVPEDLNAKKLKIAGTAGKQTLITVFITTPLQDWLKEKLIASASGIDLDTWEELALQLLALPGKDRQCYHYDYQVVS